MKFIEYIQGKRRGKEANKLEREAMNDPFVQDAIDGFDAVEGNHVQDIDELERRIMQQATRRKRFVPYRAWAIGVAASLVLMLGIGSLFYFRTEQPQVIALHPPVRVTLPPADTARKSTPAPEERAVAQQMDKKLRKPAAVLSVQPTAESNSEPIKTQEEINESKQHVSVSDVSAGYDIADVHSTKDIADVMPFRPTDSNKAQADKVQAASPNSSSVRKESVNQPTFQFSDVKAPSGVITGQVLDDAGEPLIGATVKVKGMNLGTITNAEGKFELPAQLNGKDKLVASYIGFENEEIPAGGNSYIIKLKPSSSALSEVVVVGYASQRKSSVVGSIREIPVTGEKFGEKEFEKYYKTHHRAGLCDRTEYVLKARFRIDANGKPLQIEVTQSPCPEIEQEFTALLMGAPVWTKTNRTVKLTIRM